MLGYASQPIQGGTRERLGGTVIQTDSEECWRHAEILLSRNYTTMQDDGCSGQGIA